VVDKSLESRFEEYGEVIGAALAHADRRLPAQWYLRGLMLPGGRKSVEPMAARVHPQNVRSAHQSMHHLVANADWSDQGLLAAVTAQVLPALLKKNQEWHWIVDDTGFAKKGRHSVGVARQYCGRLGKTDNCQVAVSLSIANERGSLPVAYQLYLPQDWAADRTRRKRAGVPQEIESRTKGALARSVTWREGTNSPLRSRFAALRVRAANDRRARTEEWLLIEWPRTEAKPVHYWLCTVPPDTALKSLGAQCHGSLAHRARLPGAQVRARTTSL
jgi:SRSO17 transposase